MGEARRRKLVGLYPEPGDALAAARRLWCGRAPVAAADFVAPAGLICITLDVNGADPSTAMIEASDLVPALAEAARMAANCSYRQFVRTIAQEFVRARRVNDDAPLQWLAPAALWSAFEHPQTGDAMRRAVSADLRGGGKAHLTWRFGPDGLALALGERFVDLAAASALAPKDAVTLYRFADQPEEATH